ncbi:hypothetical protein HS088_TW18G00521 [Tripterygium wilfordii]|uniref:Secreted protein n=1 Tax=Tripterygium wilfordii TaxID=458696 RepID=A0A7J7CDM6_TRIWF|nr:hypothetical protein HS088_TW18G00521 [Tripterygium wilfordii]
MKIGCHVLLTVINVGCLSSYGGVVSGQISSLPALSVSISLPGLNGNDRLPGAVLLARARLLERLRGVSVSRNRRSSRASSGVSRREQMFGDEPSLASVGD